MNIEKYQKTWPQEYGNPAWFVESRFGLFIHFGLFSIPARHEWGMTLEETSAVEYAKYFDHFNPDLFDADRWAQQAKEIGFKYVVITAKHHEGFALWDSELTEYKVTNTPYGKDILKEMIEAFKKVGIKVGIYYSLIDWHHQDFLVDGYHPERNNETYIAEHAGDMESYRTFMHGQVKELLSNYGTIDYIWFDFSYPDRDWGKSLGKGKADWGSVELEKMILNLQPNIIINDRLDLDKGVGTPEQYQRKNGMEKEGHAIIWEACQTLNGSWGYDRDNLDFKTPEMVVKLLIENVSKGGNMLLNVGPTGRGVWDEKSIEILDEVAKWMKFNSAAITGCDASPYEAPQDCRYTQKDNKLYIHLFSWPYRTLLLEEIGKKVTFARILSDGSEIRFKQSESITGKRPSNTDLRKEITEINIKEAFDKDSLILNLPIQKPNDLVPVIELTLAE